MEKKANNLTAIGKFVNTHGIKGEIRLLSKYEYENEIEIGKKVIIKDKTFIINSKRKHKNFTLLTFEGISNINDIEYLKGNEIYTEISASKEHIPEYINSIIYLNKKEVGKVIDYFQQGSI
jgi:16S rRNA processing protein RimM